MSGASDAAVAGGDGGSSQEPLFTDLESMLTGDNATDNATYGGLAAPTEDYISSSSSSSSAAASVSSATARTAPPPAPTPYAHPSLLSTAARQKAYEALKAKTFDPSTVPVSDAHRKYAAQFPAIVECNRYGDLQSLDPSLPPVQRPKKQVRCVPFRWLWLWLWLWF